MQLSSFSIVTSIVYEYGRLVCKRHEHAPHQDIKKEKCSQAISNLQLWSLSRWKSQISNARAICDLHKNLCKHNTKQIYACTYVQNKQKPMKSKLKRCQCTSKNYIANGTSLPESNAREHACPFVPGLKSTIWWNSSPSYSFPPAEMIFLITNFLFSDKKFRVANFYPDNL